MTTHKINLNHTSKEELQKYAGVDFYNYVTFILERLPIFYIAHNQLSTLNLIGE